MVDAGPGGAGVPPIDAALARRIEAADIEYAAARLESIATLPGNPYGAAVLRIGSAVALRLPGMRTPMFHRLCLADDSLVTQLDDAIAAVTAPGVPARADLLPPLPSTRLIPELARRGFRCTHFYSGLYGLTRPVERHRPFPGRIRRLGANELDQWLQVYARGFGFAGELGKVMVQSLRGLPGRGQAELLVAELSGTIAAIAALWVSGTIGYLAVAATLPEARGQGCHTALLDARIRLASERGCTLVAAHAAVGSASQRNMELAGLRLAFHKAIWMRPPPPAAAADRPLG